VQARLGLASDKFFMRRGFSRLFRFGAFRGVNFPGERGEPEFREDVTVTVIERDGAKSTEHLSRRKKIEDSDIIDVEMDDKK
jgi:hypothetical protein